MVSKSLVYMWTEILGSLGYFPGTILGHSLLVDGDWWPATLAKSSWGLASKSSMFPAAWRASQTAKESEHLCSVNEARHLSANKQDDVLHKTTHPKSYNTLQQSLKKKKSRVPRVRRVSNRTKSYILLFKTKLRPTHYRYWYEHRVKPSLTYNKHKTNQHQSIRKYQCSRFY